MNKKFEMNIGNVVSTNFTDLEPEDKEELSGCVDTAVAKLAGLVEKYKITSYKVEASMIPSQADKKYFVKIIATRKGKDMVVEESSNGKVDVCNLYKTASSKMMKMIYGDRDKFIDSKRKPYS
jgi:hypothetical protein